MTNRTQGVFDIDLHYAREELTATALKQSSKGKARQNGSQILANGNVQPPAGLH